MPQDRQWTTEDILSILPHRAPFLFVDSVIKLTPDVSIVTEHALRPDAPHFAGHFPQKAIMPGVLVTDALAQSAGLLIGLSKMAKGEQRTGDPQIFFLASANMKYTNPSFPGETLRMTAHAEKSFGALFSYAVEAAVGRTLVARGTLMLAMVEGSI
jgi:3-hydroxyacyl-[acyl-carrier-protein] dehydratase